MNRQIFVLMLLVSIGITTLFMIFRGEQFIESVATAPALQVTSEQSVESAQTNRPPPRTEMVQGSGDGPVRVETSVSVSVK